MRLWDSLTKKEIEINEEECECLCMWSNSL